jgi:hypothetical protein
MSVPAQVRHVIRVFLSRTPCKFLFFILGLDAVIVHTGKPFQRHRATLWDIEAILHREIVDPRPIQNEFLCSI